MKPPRLEGLMTYEQLATALQMSVGTLRNWVSEGFIPHVKLGRLVRFDPEAVEQWLQRRSHPGRSRQRVEPWRS